MSEQQAPDQAGVVGLDEFLRDPFAALAQARQRGWLADTQPLRSVVKHADVRTLLADPRLHANFVSFLEAFGVASGPFYEWMAISPLNHDGDDHRRWRSVMSRTFTPRSVEQLRPYLEATALELIDGFIGAGSCDFVSDFADLYPSHGLCELVGVPVEDRDRFREWANTIGLGFSPLALITSISDVDDALTNLLSYADELIEQRRRDPRDDLVSRIAHAADEDPDFPADLVRGSIAGLVFAGHETTKNQLGWMVSALSSRPDLWDQVSTGELDATTVVEEVLRFRSTVTAVGRRVDESFEHHGTVLDAGDDLLLSLWSADHDEDVYEAEAVLDPAANADTPHLAFGHGAHHCLGAALARAELQEALSALTRRLTCPTVGDAVWKPPIGINGPERLPISFAARP